MGLLAIPLGAFAFLVIYLVYNALRPGLRDIPGPFLAKFTNLYRLMLNHGGRFSNDILDLHRRYGKVVRIGPDVVSISDSRVVDSIYGIRTNFPKSDWVRSSQTLYQGKVVPALMTTQDKDVHSSLKKPIASAYSVTTLMGYETYVNDMVNLFVKRIDEEFIRTGKECDLHNWLQYYAYDVIGMITMSRPMGLLEEGKDIDGMLGEIKDEADYRALGAQMPALDYWCRKNPIIARLGLPTHKIMLRAKDILEKRLADKSVQTEDRMDFITRFMEAKDKNPGLLNDRNMLGFVGSNLQAGSDTTAIALRTIFYHILKDKRILETMRKEIDASTTELPVGFQKAFNELPYTDAVIREALRIHPPFAMLLERFVPEEGLELPNGTKLPPGTVVGMFGYTMHRDEEIYGQDPDSFVPERWLQKDGEDEEEFKDRIKRMKAFDMSFGHGSRSCVGRHIAELQIYKMVPTVVALLNFNFVLPGQEWRVEQKFFSIQSSMDVRVKWRKGAGRDLLT